MRRDLTIQGVPQGWAEQAGALTALQALQLNGYSLNSAAPRACYSGITALRGLTRLHVAGSPFHAVGDADSVMAAAAALPALRELSLRSCAVLSPQTWCPSLRSLAGSLTSLEVHELWGLAGPMQLSALRCLRSLAFAKPELPGIDGLPAAFRGDVDAWHHLQHLSLQNCDLTCCPRGVWLLRQLRSLDLSRCRPLRCSQIFRPCHGQNRHK